MSGDDVSKIVLGILTSLGGIGGVILIVIKFSSDTIAKRLEEKYSLRLNKELENYKSKLDSKTYISKAKFDTEFSVYRELSKSFFEMAKTITAMIPSGFARYPADPEARKEYENELYSKALQATVIAQDALFSNASFISNELYDKYDEILMLCRQQLSSFEERWNVYYLAPQSEKESFSRDDYKRSREINEKLKELNQMIREYLSKIDVID